MHGARKPNPENPPTVAANGTEAKKEKGDSMYSLAYGNIQEEVLLDHTVARHSFHRQRAVHYQ